MPETLEHDPVRQRRLLQAIRDRRPEGEAEQAQTWGATAGDHFDSRGDQVEFPLDRERRQTAVWLDRGVHLPMMTGFGRAASAERHPDPAFW